MNATAVTLFISFVTDFLITAGGVLLGAMLTPAGAVLPPSAVWVVALITATVQASRRVQALIQPTAINQATTIRTPEQLVAQTKANTAQIAAVTEAVTRAVATTPPPVTPQRVEPVAPPPPAPVPKSDFS